MAEVIHATYLAPAFDIVALLHERSAASEDRSELPVDVNTIERKGPRDRKGRRISS